ncbi:MAG: hypothetical protein GEU73_04785 [Chloroflexi bacterium]|nr:hypothetical protein [Chloroflexota bacterium]
MCTYIVETASVLGSGKGPESWIALNRANVCVDHPAHASLDHAVLIDFVNEGLGPSARVAVELSAESARELVQAIQTALEEAEHVHAL